MSAQPGFTLVPMPKTATDKHDFGAVVEGLDLDTISDGDVAALAEAIWTHKLVVVKAQAHIHPAKQWDLVTRFDPAAPQVHSHGDVKSFNEKGGILTVNAIPGVENVRIVGKGFQGRNHYGLENLTIEKDPLHNWHAVPLPDADFDKGHTRFQRWHLDAPLYDRDPAWFTTLRCVRRPRAPPVTVHWDDGSGQTMTVGPGLTAFFSNVQAYALLSDDERALADHSWVEYAPHPYMWLGGSQASPNGLGIWSVGQELSLAQLGDYDAAKVKRYPMVWVNPVTGERAFMVHGICVRRMFLRCSQADAPEVVDDLARIRAWLRPIQERVLRPEYIVVPELDEGDIVMWANYQLFHSAIDYPPALGARTMHQANIGASRGPVGPFPIPA